MFSIHGSLFGIDIKGEKGTPGPRKGPTPKSKVPYKSPPPSSSGLLGTTPSSPPANASGHEQVPETQETQPPERKKPPPQNRSPEYQVREGPGSSAILQQSAEFMDRASEGLQQKFLKKQAEDILHPQT